LLTQASQKVAFWKYILVVSQKSLMNMSLSIHVMSPNFVGDSSVYVSARHADFVVMVSKTVEEDDTKVVDEQHKPLSLFFFFFFF
jgi:hypothetical protein